MGLLFNQLIIVLSLISSIMFLTACDEGFKANVSKSDRALASVNEESELEYGILSFSGLQSGDNAPLSLGFGDLEVGLAKTLELTVYNIGRKDVRNLLVSVYGDSFSIIDSNCENFLAPGSSCRSVIEFAPAHERYFYGVIQFIGTGKRRQEIRLNLTGRGMGGEPATTTTTSTTITTTTLPPVPTTTTTTLPGDVSDNWSFNNVPEGLVLYNSNPFQELTPSGWDIKVNQSDRRPEIVNELNPIDSTVLRQWWSGVEDRWSPDYAFLRLPQVREAFFGVIFRINEDWDWGTGNGWSKWFTLLNGQANGWWGFNAPGSRFGTRNMVERYQTEAPAWSDQFHDYTATGDNTYTTEKLMPAMSVENGQWMKLEMYINAVSPDQFRVQAWINGTPVLDAYPGLWPSAPLPFHEIKLGSTLGGASGIGVFAPLDSRYYVDYALFETYLPNSNEND